MCENFCRVCGKNIKEKNPMKLFDDQNKVMVLQIKDLTGVRLKNNSALPSHICCICKKDLINAYKFREGFLKVQASFKIKCSKRSKKQTSKGLVEATEFVQVFVVKEEKIDVLDHREGFYATDEEKEINIVESQDLNRKQTLLLSKNNREEINALELRPNEENTLEDTKFFLEDVCERANQFDYLKPLSDSEDLDRKDIDKFYKPEAKILPVKNSKLIRKCAKKDIATNEITNIERICKTGKTRTKHNDAKKQSNIFICDQCGNHFTCRHHFKLHLRRHSGDKRCACELCPDKFFTNSELRRHMRKHTGERPFPCKYCDRRFTDYSTRIKHERTHTNERPFMCSQCGKSFTTSYILKNHMLTHTGERHFRCDVCNRSFTRRTHLVVHFRSMMHKQAVEKDKSPISQDNLSQPHCFIKQSTQISSFTL